MANAAYAKKLSMNVMLSKAKSHAHAKSHADLAWKFFYAERQAADKEINRQFLG